MDSKYHSEYEQQFRPSRRQLRDYPWARDNLEQPGKPPPAEVLRKPEEDFAGHTTERMHKFDVVSPQKQHNRLCQETSPGLLGTNHGKLDDPHKTYFDKLAADKNLAGVRSRPHEFIRATGFSPRGRMNEIIPLEERDGVREGKMDQLCKGAAGVRSYVDPRRQRRQGLPMQDQMDQVVLGREMESADKHWAENQRRTMLHWEEEAAGLPHTGFEKDWDVENCRQGGRLHREGYVRMGTTVGATVAGLDIAYDDSFQEMHGATAGFDKRSAARVKQRSTSAPGSRRQTSDAAGRSSNAQNSRNFKPPFRF